MKIALLGAGHIGHTIARLLVESGDYQLTVVDQSKASLDKLAKLGVNTAVVDTSNADALEASARMRARASPGRPLRTSWRKASTRWTKSRCVSARCRPSRPMRSSTT